MILRRLLSLIFLCCVALRTDAAPASTRKPVFLYYLHFQAPGENRYPADGSYKDALDVLRREIEISQTQEAWSDALTQVNRTSFVASQVNGGLLSRLGLE